MAEERGECRWGRWTEKQIEDSARALCVRHKLDPDRLQPGNTPYGDSTEVCDGKTKTDEPAFFMWRLFAGDALVALNAAFPRDADDGCRGCPCHEPLSVVKDSLTPASEPNKEDEL